MAVLRSTVINDTGYLSLPSGTTAQRLGETNTTLVYFTSVGATTWTVPANIDTVEVLVVGGGGGGGQGLPNGTGGAVGSASGTTTFVSNGIFNDTDTS